MSDSTSTPEVLRPLWHVFVLLPALRSLFSYSAIAIGAYLFLPLFLGSPLPLVPLLFLLFLLVLFRILSRWVTYRRTFYEFYPDRLVAKRGGLFSTAKVDLPYRNITQVVLHLPFLERRLFQTGNLQIHSAGSSQGTAFLLSVQGPREVYRAMGSYMQDAGFSLSRATRVQREKPHPFGTLLDTSGLALGGIVALFTFGLSIGGTVIDVMGLKSFYELFDVLRGTVEHIDGEKQTTAYRATLGLAVLLVLGGLFGIVKLVLHYIDLNRRTYTLWEDVVDYSDGFLTETEMFIPIENLADTSINEPFLKRLFGIANVEINPQGAAGGVQFPSMPRAETFRNRLHKLIESSEGLKEKESVHDPSQSAHGARGSERDELPEGYRVFPGPRLGPSGPPREFRPSLFRGLFRALQRAIAPTIIASLIVVAAYVGILEIEEVRAELEGLLTPVVMVLLPLVAFGLTFIYHVFGALFLRFTTTFGFRKKQVTSIREFISRDEVEFTLDKITTFEVERSLLDRILGVESLQFSSIGNDAPLRFQDLRKSLGASEEIKERLHFEEDQALILDEARDLYDASDADALEQEGYKPKSYRKIAPAAPPWSFVFERPILISFLFLLAIGAYVGGQFYAEGIYGVAILLLLPLLYLRELIQTRAKKLELFEDFLVFSEGILRRRKTYLAYAQARAIRHRRYPFSSRGKLWIQPGNDRVIAIPYVDSLTGLHQELDRRLYSAPIRRLIQPENLKTLSLLKQKPEARNAMIITVVLLFLAPLWPLLLPYLFLRYRRSTYFIEEGRLRVKRDLLYREEHTVLHNRIDQLVTHRGVLHTLCNNGAIQVLTIGSTTPEIELGPLREDENFFRVLKTLIPGQ